MKTKKILRGMLTIISPAIITTALLLCAIGCIQIDDIIERGGIAIVFIITADGT